MLQLIAPLAARGWTVDARMTATHRTYRVDARFCEAILARTADDRAFTWRRPTTCTGLRAVVRAALDAWQRNSLMTFEEVRAGVADITFRTGSAVLASDVIASTSFDDRAFATITFHAERCWYTDRLQGAFCDPPSAEDNPELRFALAAIVGSACFVVCGMCTAAAGSALAATATLLPCGTIFLWSTTWTLSMAVTCLRCRDFTRTVVHEAGHAIGIGHADDASGRRFCGCGSNASRCGVSPKTSIMNSDLSTSVHWACLARDDVDAVRSLYGGACDAPRWCPPPPTDPGRLVACFAYSLAIALCGAALVWRHAVRGTLARCAPAPPPPPGPVIGRTGTRP